MIVIVSWASVISRHSHPTSQTPSKLVGVLVVLALVPSLRGIAEPIARRSGRRFSPSFGRQSVLIRSVLGRAENRNRVDRCRT